MDWPSLLYVVSLTVALFLGGTPMLAGAIYFAVSGSLDIRLLFALSLMTTVVWDIVWYLIGHRAVSIQRMKEWRIYKRNASLYDKVLALYGRHQYFLLFVSRFAYGTNSVCSVVSGASRMSLPPFIAINAVSLSIFFGILAALSSAVHTSADKLEFPFSLSVMLTILVAVIIGARWGGRKLFDRYVLS